MGYIHFMVLIELYTLRVCSFFCVHILHIFKVKNKNIKDIFEVFLKSYKSGDIMFCLQVMEWIPITLTRLLDVTLAYLSVLNLHYSHFFIMSCYYYFPSHKPNLFFSQGFRTCSKFAWCSFPIPLCGCLFLILQAPVKYLLRTAFPDLST